MSIKELICKTGAVVVFVTGCSADNGKDTKNDPKHYKVKETDIRGIEQITINGSPTPPDGYKRPVVDEKKIREKEK